MSTSTVTPLKKVNREGELYTRRAPIEAKLKELQSVPRERLLSRSEVQDRADPGYVPSECILHFLRACRNDESDAHFEKLYKLLAERVLKRLRRGARPDDDKVPRNAVWERGFDRFVEMLAEDRTAYCEKLDFFEVCFDAALRALRTDILRVVYREQKQEKAAESIEIDGDTGEPMFESDTGYFQFLNAGSDCEDYRFGLDQTIEQLPTLQRAILKMISEGIPIDSKEPDVLTIAKALRKSEKTIRNQRDKAFATIKFAAKRKGEEQ
jgi:hypothetical protein